MLVPLLLKRRVIISLLKPSPDYLLIVLLKARKRRANIWERIYIGWGLLLSQQFRSILSRIENAYPNGNWTGFKWKLKCLPIIHLLLLAGILSAIVYRFPDKAFTWNIIEITKGHTGFVILPDSSLVDLNAASQFKVSADYYKNPVIYLEGEGLFRLRPGGNRKVTLKTKDAEITAAESTFNVSTYGNKLLIACLVGSALVKIKDGRKVSLNAGLSFLYDFNSKSWNTAKANIDTTTSWIQGVFYLSHEKMGEICKQIERVYNVSIVFDRQECQGYRFTGKFSRSDSINVILNTLSHAGNMQYFYDSTGAIHWR